MRPIQKTLSFLTADVEGIATAQTPAPATDGVSEAQTPANNADLALDGDLTLPGEGAILYFAATITLTSSSDFSGTTFTIVGTDANGDPQTENLAGPNNDTVSSVKQYLTVTQIATDASGYTVETVEAGAVYSYLINDGTFATGGLATAPVPATVTLTSSDDLSAFTFVFQGYDENGKLLSETLAGPNNNTVEGTLLFKEVFGIATDADGLIAQTVSAGFADAGDFGTTAWWPLDIYTPNQVTTISCNELSGAVTYSVEYTNEDPFDTSITQLAVAHPATSGAFTNATTSQTHSTTTLMRAVRVNCSAGYGDLRVTVVQQSTA